MSAATPVAGPARRRAVLAFVLLLFFECLLLYRYGWRHENLLHVDLPSFYFATHMAFRHGQSPYDVPAMAEQAPRIGQPPIDHPALRHGPWIHLVSLRTYAVLALWLVLLLAWRPVVGDRRRPAEPAGGW